MDCIRCNIRMNKEIKNGVLIDVCPICDGVWLDHNELEMLETGVSKAYTKLLKELYTETAEEKARDANDGLCPKCGQVSLQLSILHGVEIDHCPACQGMYFDWGELEDVIRARSV